MRLGRSLVRNLSIARFFYANSPYFKYLNILFLKFFKFLTVAWAWLLPSPSPLTCIDHIPSPLEDQNRQFRDGRQIKESMTTLSHQNASVRPVEKLYPFLSSWHHMHSHQPPSISFHLIMLSFPSESKQRRKRRSSSRRKHVSDGMVLWDIGNAGAVHERG